MKCFFWVTKCDLLLVFRMFLHSRYFLEFLRNRGFFRDMDLKSLMMMLGSELHNLVIFLKRIASGGKQ